MPEKTHPPVHFQLLGSQVISGDISWMIVADGPYSEPVSQDTVTIRIDGPGQSSEGKALTWIAKRLAAAKNDWLRPAGHPHGNWIIDLDGLRTFARPNFDNFASWTGRRIVRPRYHSEQKVENDWTGKPVLSTEWHISFIHPKPDDEEDLPMLGEREPYLDEFRMDHPNPSKTAFVMMRFMDTPLQLKAFEVVRDTCSGFGVTTLRADAKAYSDDLFPNIRTYMHGCGFGISIFERISEDEFNPNVSLEVGYMLGMGKPVLLLKDETLKQLHTDLVGRLYESFDPQRPAETIPAVVEKWLRNKGVID